MRLNRTGNSVTSDTIGNTLDLPASAAPAAASALDDTLRRCAETGRSVFLFGGDATSIRALRERVAAAHPRLRIAGICDADFSGPAGRAILDHIAACGPDVVVVDLPSRRHRALIAEVAACGLRFTLVNRPGTFATSAETRSRLRLGAAARIAAEFGTARRLAGVLMRQLVAQGGPRLSARD